MGKIKLASKNTTHRHDADGGLVFPSTHLFYFDSHFSSAGSCTVDTPSSISNKLTLIDISSQFLFQRII